MHAAHGGLALWISGALLATGWMPQASAAALSEVTFDSFQKTTVNGPDLWVSGPDNIVVRGSGPARLDLTNPSWTSPSGSGAPAQLSYQGTLQAQAQSSEGILKAQASALGGQEALSTGVNTGVYSVSSWQEGVLVTGGQGQGVLQLTARLSGLLSVSGPLNSEGHNGLAYASMNLVSSDTALAPFETPLTLDLTFACSNGTEAAECFYDTQRFRPLAGLQVASDQTQAYDRSVTFAVPFTYNKPFQLMGILEVGAYAYSIGGYASADFFHTGTITGFSAPAGATVQLQSGAYEAFALPSPVPEPSQWALAGFGALVALAMRRRPQAPRTPGKRPA